MNDWQSNALESLEQARECIAREVRGLIKLTPTKDLFGGVTPEIDGENCEFTVELEGAAYIPRETTVTVHVEGYGEINVVCFAAMIGHDTYEDNCCVVYAAAIEEPQNRKAD